MARKMRTQLQIPPSRVWNFDEIRIYSSPQDLHSHTLEFRSVRDPMVMKVANPKEAYTGIILGNGDGSTLQVFLVTTKALPPESVVHEVEIEERSLDSGAVLVTSVKIPFAVIAGVTVIKVPPGRKAWCSTAITEAMLRLALFRVDEPHLLQVSMTTELVCVTLSITSSMIRQEKKSEVHKNAVTVQYFILLVSFAVGLRPRPQQWRHPTHNC